MYRCEVCQTTSEPRQPRRTHVLYKDAPPGQAGWDILREVAVCEECHWALGQGATFAQLVKLRGRRRERGETAPLPDAALETVGEPLLRAVAFGTHTSGGNP